VTSSQQDEIFERGIDLFNEGRFFECHEVWEDIWLRAEGGEKLFLQGMIQAAVAILHAQRGNLEGARGQYAKSCAKIDSIADSHRGLAMDEFRDQLKRFFEIVLSTGAIPAPPKISRAT
jgi:predicted metal-dependent hydrolase